MINETYGIIHKLLKKILGKNNMDLSNYKMVNFDMDKFANNTYTTIYSYNNTFINENDYKKGDIRIYKSNVYPIENLVPLGFDSKFSNSFSKKKFRYKKTTTLLEAKSAWKDFINNSKISNGYKYSGLSYGGYIKEYSEWCLPSWIWTNAAIVRYYCQIDEVGYAEQIAEVIFSYQDKTGGWVVRNDYSVEGVIPELAPNDSAYIANNCFISLYLKTNNDKYLNIAKTTADWIIEEARGDGFVLFGFDKKREMWIEDRNIVDVGFTAALFANLYEITHDKRYYNFLKKFSKRYIEIFYIKRLKCFATAVDANDKQKGGAFGRGQAWALEGLIPAYRVLKDECIKNVIENTINTLIKKQQINGGWAYNLLKPLMGIDCKATPVIAKSLLDWYKINPEKVELIGAANKAIEWCIKHTAYDGEGRGGIFSYTIEGAIVHHMYTNTALVYASAYALEVCSILENN